jgi:hypothetical protein
MDKKDIMYIIGGLCIILIIALIVKPILTGKPINTGIPTPTPTPIPFIENIAAPVVIDTTILTTIPTTEPTPTPIQTWDTKTKGVVFVDPSTYGVSFNQSIPQGTKIDNILSNTSMISYAKINGKYSGTTQSINIPFPSWQLVYTITPIAPLQPAKVAVVPTKGESNAYSGISGSYSSVTPQFSIQVMDAMDPNRIVRTITPPGGVDFNLWMGTKKSVTNPQVLTSGNQKATVSSDTVYVDPRPWTEKFYEGQRTYYFIIKTQSIESYSIDIKIPSEYLGVY